MRRAVNQRLVYHTGYFVTGRMMAKWIEKLYRCCETYKRGIPAGVVWWKSFAALGRKQTIRNKDSPNSMYSLTINVKEKRCGELLVSFISQMCKSCYESISLYMQVCVTEADRGDLDFNTEDSRLKPWWWSFWGCVCCLPFLRGKKKKLAFLPCN